MKWQIDEPFSIQVIPLFVMKWQIDEKFSIQVIPINFAKYTVSPRVKRESHNKKVLIWILHMDVSAII